MEFISIRARLWARLEELSRVKIKSESERIEESVKAREFWAWAPVEDRIRHPIIGFDPAKQTPLQLRVMMAAKNNAPVKASEACR